MFTQKRKKPELCVHVQSHPKQECLMLKVTHELTKGSPILYREEGRRIAEK